MEMLLRRSQRYLYKHTPLVVSTQQPRAVIYGSSERPKERFDGPHKLRTSRIIHGYASHSLHLTEQGLTCAG